MSIFPNSDVSAPTVILKSPFFALLVKSNSIFTFPPKGFG